MSSSNKKTEANRRNGQNSHGPKDTTSTRFNATKHGLLARGITELDDAESYRAILDNLRREKAPVGTLETALVESLALEIARLPRARRLEAEYITAVLNPPILKSQALPVDLFFEPTVIDPGLPAAIHADCMAKLVSLYQRYETAIHNRIFRLIHELERLQRMRNGESLPAPAVLDVQVHADTRVVDPESYPSTIDAAPRFSEEEQIAPEPETGEPTLSNSNQAHAAVTLENLGLHHSIRNRESLVCESSEVAEVFDSTADATSPEAANPN
jgi:hypothetical protein